MKRLVEYESTESEDESIYSVDDDCEINKNSKIERDVKATLNYLLNETSKSDRCNFSFDRKGYRDMLSDNVSIVDSSGTDESDDSTSVSSENGEGDGAASDDSDCIYSRIVSTSRQMKNRTVRPGRIIKTKGEFTLEDLPPIENLRITVPKTVRFLKVGVVSSIVDSLVIILSDFKVPALGEDTLLFTEDRQSLGKVFETFGPVVRPFYSIRFNSAEEIETMQLRLFTSIYFVPDHVEFTHTVFTDALRQIKGTDASWEDNNEPPNDVAEFSDDEEEKRWKARRRNKQQQAVDGNNFASDGASAESVPVPRKRIKAHRKGANRRGNHAPSFQGSMYSNSSSYAGSTQNAAMYSMSSSHPRNPWHGPSRPTGMYNFNASVPPPPPSNNWMWMSEETFRLPPPPLPHGFGRMRMALPPQVRMRPAVPDQYSAVLSDHRFVQRNA